MRQISFVNLLVFKDFVEKRYHIYDKLLANAMVE